MDGWDNINGQKEEQFEHDGWTERQAMDGQIREFDWVWPDSSFKFVISYYSVLIALKLKSHWLHWL